MFNLLTTFLLYLLRYHESCLIQQLEYLKIENQIYRKRLGKHKFKTTRDEQTQLIEFGLPLGNTLNELITIVTPKTFMKWIRNSEDQSNESPTIKTSKFSSEVRALVVRLARENPTWGYTKIQGELLKLGIEMGRTTIWRILNQDFYLYKPGKGPRWNEFIQRHMETLWACDFSGCRTYTTNGLVYVYFLVFIHIGSRRVYYAGCTEHPTSEWVEQHARNFCMHLQDHDFNGFYLIHDRDTKFTGKFDIIVKSEGIQPLKLPRCSPNLNAYCESWFSNLKRECLNQFVVIGEKHLDYLVREYVDYYNHERPHQSLNNKTIVPFPIKAEGGIRCMKRLAGVLKSYYRQAA